MHTSCLVVLVVVLVLVLGHSSPNASTPSSSSTSPHVKVLPSPMFPAHVPSGQHAQPSQHIFVVLSSNGQHVRVGCHIISMSARSCRVLCIDTSVVVLVLVVSHSPLSQTAVSQPAHLAQHSLPNVSPLQHTGT